MRALHGQADPLTSPAYVGVRLLAFRRSRFAVATLPPCVRRSLRVMAAGWERRQRTRPRAGLGASSSYVIHRIWWGRRGA